MTLEPRIYVTSDDDAAVRAIANTANHQYSPGRAELCVSYDGTTFHTVLFNTSLSGPGYYDGKIVQPALDIDGHPISFANGEMTYDGHTYVLDENASIGEIITDPVMRIVSIVETHAGFYVTTQNYLTGRSHDYLDGKPLTIIDGIRARGAEGDLVEDTQYAGHRYIVRGDHMDMTRQTATFDGLPATQLNPDNYRVVFGDDLSTIEVFKK